MGSRDQQERKLSTKQRLSDTLLENHGPAPSGKRINIGDTTPGFGCRITDKRAISFFVMRRRTGLRNGRPIRIVLGPYGPQWDTETARARAKSYLNQLSAGIYPHRAKYRTA